MFNLFRKGTWVDSSHVPARNDDPDAHPAIHNHPTTIPPTAISYRHDPVHNVAHDAQPSGPNFIREQVELAPPPVAYTQWWNVGRDPAHAWPRQWLYQFASPRDWLSVAGWPFSSVGHTPSGSMVYSPPGQFMPQIGRANINSPGQTSLGALTAVQAPITIDLNHAKVLF